ncbi:MAG: ABC transporter ATP-binding protein [Alphaproteobacteria bacterium]|nr:ABC transporter ATP-binding protein [Alphaproteobacteria bacterium]
MAIEQLLALRDVRLTYGGTPLLDGVDLAIGVGDRVCLVGRNGSGKSNLLRIAAGQIEPDAGECIVTKGVGIRYLPQEPDLNGFATVLEYVEAGLGPADDPYQARRVLEALGFSGAEGTSTLSGGEIRRAALARVLAPDPDVLLLDEPTNHLDLPAIEWLEEELASRRSALILVSHDRRLLTNVCRNTLWLDRGVVRRLTQGFAAFEEWRDTILEQEEVERHKLDRKIAAEEDWVRYGVSGRRKRNQKRLRDLGGLRQTLVESQRAIDTVKLTVNDAEDVTAKLVIEARKVGKAWGEQTVIQDLSLRILHGDRLGIVGPNGSGKTTLLRMLTGDLKPDAGYVRHGVRLQPVTLDQKRASLDPARTLQETLTGGTSDQVTVGGVSKHVVGYMRDFLFRPEQARTPVGVLSGGERGRLMLACALAQQSNLLVLDEPTNDLDLETLDLLQEMLAEYPGTALVVSHDRDFLDRVATAILAYDGDGRWIEYAGGYSDMVAQRGHGVRAKAPASAPAPEPRAPKPRAAQSTEPRPGRPRLGFKEQHALKTLPKQMEALAGDVVVLEARLADSALFARDKTSFQAAATKLAETRAALAAAEDQWLALEMRREEIEGGP